jgi:cyclophilin family peptidyl-prolyl cis-trans isomerase
MTNPTVVFETTKGKIEAAVYSDKAPITAENFLNLVKDKFYDGLTFHRYEPGFVVQGGDPKGDGTGGSKKSIKLEIVPELKHELGSLSMARTNDPDSATSQFFIVIGEAHFLDGKYAVFGQITEGGDKAMQLRKGDKMEKVYIKESS